VKSLFTYYICTTTLLPLLRPANYHHAMWHLKLSSTAKSPGEAYPWLVLQASKSKKVNDPPNELNSVGGYLDRLPGSESVPLSTTGRPSVFTSSSSRRSVSSA